MATSSGLSIRADGAGTARAHIDGNYQVIAPLVARDAGLGTIGRMGLLMTPELGPRVRLAVVTTRARPEAIAFLEHSGLHAYVQAVVTRQDVLRMKPHPEPVRTAANLLGVTVESCLMIGDTINDILAARRAGAYAIGVLSGFGERRELERAGADLILDTAADMLSQPFWLAANR